MLVSIISVFFTDLLPSICKMAMMYWNPDFGFGTIFPISEGMSSSVCRNVLGTYHGAFTKTLSTSFLNIYIISRIDRFTVPERDMSIIKIISVSSTIAVLLPERLWNFTVFTTFGSSNKLEHRFYYSLCLRATNSVLSMLFQRLLSWTIIRILR